MRAPGDRTTIGVVYVDKVVIVAAPIAGNAISTTAKSAVMLGRLQRFAGMFAHASNAGSKCGPS